MSFNIVFAGTPDFAAEALQALLNSTHSVLAVYTQPDRPAGRGRELKPSPVKQLAIQNHINVYQPPRLKDAKEQDILRSLHPDILVVAAYGLILPPAVLSIPRLGCINIHASLLPRWRGASPIQQSILANDKKTGITIMQMDAGLDTGDILLKSECSIDSKDTSETLHSKLATLGAKTLLEALEKLEKNQIQPQKQDNQQATFAGKIAKEDAFIDWQESTSVLDCKIRAYNPWPVAFTYLENQVIRIWKAEPLLPNLILENPMPGTIIKSTKEGIDIATGDGILRLLEIQWPGGKRLPVAEMLKAKSGFFTEKMQFKSK